MRTGYVAAFGVGTTLSLLGALWAVKRVMGRARSLRADLGGANSARSMGQVGEVFAVFLLGAAVVKNCVTGASLQHDLIWTAAFAGIGLAMLHAVALAGERLLFGAKLTAELARGNIAAGVAAGANAVAMGLLVSRAAGGTSLRSVGIAMAFFALAVVTHAGFVALFRTLTTYDDEEQICGENLAAAISYAGVTIAVAVMVARGVEGDFEGWAKSLRGYAGVVAWTLALYPVRQVVVQGMLLGARPTLRGGALDAAIAGERSEGMAALEASAYLGAALAISTLA